MMNKFTEIKAGRSFLFLLLFVLTSCHHYKPEEYLKKVSVDKAFVKLYKDSVFNVRCSYLSSTFLAITDLQKNPERMKKISAVEFESDKKRFENGDYFRISMGLNSGQNLLTYNVQGNQDYSKRLFYLNNFISNDIYIFDQESNRQIKPLSVEFYNNYGMSATVNFTVVFPRTVYSGNFKLVYEDKLFGFSKAVEFEYNYKKISSNNYKILFKNE